MACKHVSLRPTPKLKPLELRERLVFFFEENRPNEEESCSLRLVLSSDVPYAQLGKRRTNTIFWGPWWVTRLVWGKDLKPGFAD